jgi:hypothetical protein
MPAYPGAAVTDGVPTVWYPIDYGLQSWTVDPAHANVTFPLGTAGTVYVAQLKVTGRQITNVAYQVTTAGATLTAAQCFVGVYQNGVLLGSSASTATAWATLGPQITPLAAPVNPVSEGAVYVAFVFNGTTGPTLAASAATGATNPTNFGLAAGTARFGTANTGVTTALPATLGTVTAITAAPWVALS